MRIIEATIAYLCIIRGHPYRLEPLRPTLTVMIRRQRHRFRYRAGAQLVMALPAALIAMRLAECRGYWIVLLITFIALPVRGLFAASAIHG